MPTANSNKTAATPAVKPEVPVVAKPVKAKPTAKAPAKVAKAPKAAPLFALIVGAKPIAEKTAEIKSRGADLQQDVHILACSVLAHVGKHSNINVLTDFLAAVPDMVRVNALKTWFETFGQVSFSALKEGDKPSWRIDRTKKVRLGDAMVKPFWKFKANEGVPYQPLDMAKYCEQQIKTLERDARLSGHNHDTLIMFLKTYQPGANALH